jgi:hypothetical protein
VVAPRRHLRELAGVLDQHGVRLAVVDDVLDLVGRARGVDPGGRAAGHHRRVIEDHPLGPVEAQDRDLAAAREAQRDQRARCGPDLGGEGLPGRGLPAPVELGLVGDRRGERGRLPEQPVRDRIEVRHRRV